MSTDSILLTPDLVLRAYAAGIFPMAESRGDAAVHWVEPRQRGIIPLDGFHVPSRLARLVRSDRFEVRVNHDFDAVIEACAAPAPGREVTWINATIRRLYRELFSIGHCHTVEVWRDGRLVGGLYGVHLGAAFFGESMFHRMTDASKVALVHLVGRLRAGGFHLLDAQFMTEHLKQFGTIEVPQQSYLRLLRPAIAAKGDFEIWPRNESVSGARVLDALPVSSPSLPDPCRPA